MEKLGKMIIEKKWQPCQHSKLLASNIITQRCRHSISFYDVGTRYSSKTSALNITEERWNWISFQDVGIWNHSKMLAYGTCWRLSTGYFTNDVCGQYNIRGCFSVQYHLMSVLNILGRWRSKYRYFMGDQDNRNSAKSWLDTIWRKRSFASE
jgi:hypothetical protein